MRIYVRSLPSPEGFRVEVLKDGTNTSTRVGTYIGQPTNGRVRALARPFAAHEDDIVLVGPDWIPPWREEWPA